MFVVKNRHALELSEANSHAKLSHSKQLLKNIHPMMLASFLFTDKSTFTVTRNTLKIPQNGRLYAYPSTKKKDVTTKRLFRQLMFQSLMTSIGEDQLVTPA